MKKIVLKEELITPIKFYLNEINVKQDLDIGLSDKMTTFLMPNKFYNSNRVLVKNYRNISKISLQ